MSEVKRHWPEDVVGTGEQYVLASDFDANEAARVKAEAECERLRMKVDNLEAGWSNCSAGLQTERDALLWEMRKHEDEPSGYKYPVSLWFPRIDALLSGTAAVQGQQSCPICGSGNVMHMTHCNSCESDYADHEQTSRNKLAALKAQQVGQEPVAVIAFYEGSDTPVLIGWERMPVGQHNLYTAPQPAPAQDVAGLVEALKACRKYVAAESDHDEQADMMLDLVDSLFAAHDKQSGG